VTRFYANAVESVLHQHPEVFAVVAELLGTVDLSFNYYDLKV